MPSALAVAPSILPVGFRLWADWKDFRAADDAGPHLPSTVSCAPLEFSAICTLATCCCFGVRLAGIVGAGGGGGAGAATGVGGGGGGGLGDEQAARPTIANRPMASVSLLAFIWGPSGAT